MKNWNEIKALFGAIDAKSTEEIEAENSRVEQRQRDQRREEIKKTIPQGYIDSGIFSYSPGYFQEYSRFIRSGRSVFWIWGGTGTGKTHMAYPIKIKRYMETSREMLVIKEHGVNYKELERIKKSIVCIDDVGLSKVAPRNISLLDNYYEIIDYKVEHKQKLIITSNYSPAEWLEYMRQYNQLTVERIMSRFGGKVYGYNLTGIDKRSSIKRTPPEDKSGRLSLSESGKLSLVENKNE